MALELEKLAQSIETMANSTLQRQQDRNNAAERALQRLREYSKAWDMIADRLRRAIEKDPALNILRTAQPLDNEDPLDVALECPELPGLATIIATDGSQILPDIHGAYLYSLINIGAIIFRHGTAAAPEQKTLPFLDYPGKAGEEVSIFDESGRAVMLRRDQQEIESLAHLVMQNEHEASPLVAVLDQRLLYWPSGPAGERSGAEIVLAWQEAMAQIRQSGAILCGYIANPRKRSVITLLELLADANGPEVVEIIERRGRSLGITDADIFQSILRPGQRSKLFVEISQYNRHYREYDPENEICFFYLNPGFGEGSIARVDLPISAARNRETVGQVHALIYDQCTVMGGYPYVLARADEVAVLTKSDEDSVNAMIDGIMRRQGIEGKISAKQIAKDVARGGKSRHKV